jgi:hypothetical protein
MSKKYKIIKNLKIKNPYRSYRLTDNKLLTD